MTMYGLAKQLETVLDDKYISGLWCRILPSQLPWHVEDFTPMNMFYAEGKSRNLAESVFTSAVWTTPTWSWASINGPVVAPAPMAENILIEFGLVEMEEQNKSGLVEYAILGFRGTIQFALLTYTPNIDHWGLDIFPRGFRIGCSPGLEVSGVSFYPDFSDMEPAKLKKKKGLLRKLRSQLEKQERAENSLASHVIWECLPLHICIFYRPP